MEDTTKTEAAASDVTAADKLNANSPKMWRARRDKSKKKRKELIRAWADNVDRRRGKPFAQDSDQNRVNVNLDWSLTKGKHAQLFSQTPQVYLTPKTEEIVQQIAPFAKKLNDTLTLADMGSAADEAVLDCINASGIGVAFCNYESTFVMKDMPAQDTTGMAPEMAALVPLIPTKQTIDRKYGVNRKSPSDLLWPDEFTQSNFDNADWLGISGTMLWSEGKREFKLDDEDKEKILAARGHDENLRQDTESDNTSDDPVIEYDEMFYWKIRFDENEKYFKKIGRIVFVEGLDEPAINEDWKGQKFDEATGRYIGACKFPIRILTLTYISDDAIPPSDSAIGLPQIEELIKSRTQIVDQRDRSQPIRWGNTNLIDPMVLDTINRGTYQGIIPVNGDGSRIVGEVARANYPVEDFQFDRVIKQDLQEQWQVSANQVGAYSQGDKSASEAKIVQQNFQARVGYERARVGKFIVGIAEVIAGFLALFDDEIDPAIKQMAGELIYYIRPDSTVLLDADQRVDKLMKLLNLTGKSGFVNPEPLIQEIVALHGVDPAKVMTKPNPPPPDQPHITYSFKGEDMLNPVVIAILMRAGQAPTQQELTQAMNLLKAVMQPTIPGMGTNVPNAGMELSQSGAPEQPPHGNVGPVGQPPPADTRPGWTPMPRLTKRVDELGG